MAKTKSVAGKYFRRQRARLLSVFSRFKPPNVWRHRSFRHSRRRDYIRPLELPGYTAFTAEVFGLLRTNRKVFVRLILLYAFLIITFGGISSQDFYGQVGLLVGEDDSTVVSAVTQAGAAALLGLSGAGSESSDIQRVYLGIAVLLAWLSTVWLLREILADRQPKMRDGLYNSGSPIVATALLVIVIIIQMLPLALLSAAYTGMTQVGLIGEGFGAMIFFAIAVLVFALCLYWITATFIALVIVSLPGMYPFRALRTASEIVSGRRLKIMYRLVWLILLALVIGLAVMVPIILVDQWLHSLADWVAIVPILPVAYALVGSAMTVLAASYIYLLYRKVVAYDAQTSR